MPSRSRQPVFSARVFVTLQRFRRDIRPDQTVRSQGAAPSPTLLGSRLSIPNQPLEAALAQDGSELAITAADGISFYSTSTFDKTGYRLPERCVPVVSFRPGRSFVDLLSVYATNGIA